ncbi:MAG: twin-arginine translocation signal domain-containing protein [Halobacteriota archaeon]|uniref:twin-arginine translocation signal domain-containing protein n=1 Tax=Natronomonas sp. TaxID=2184060 RepID=UPI00397615DF
MERSRRDLLRASGALLATAGVAGCIEERVTRRETRSTDTNTWTLSPDDEDVALDIQSFENYVERMTDRYDDSGVWGLEAERPESFDVAYVQRYAITRETPGNPTNSEFSLVPETVDPEAPVLIGDSCLTRYDLGDGRYRYWLWVAADPTDGRLVRDVNLTRISTGVRLRNGILTDAATPSASNGEASVGLGTPPSGRFPVRGGSIDTTSVLEETGLYTVDWRGDIEASQSANGVCEVERDGEYGLFWTMGLGYDFEETI